MPPSYTMTQYLPAQSLRRFITYYEYGVFDNRMMVDHLKFYPSFAQGLIFYLYTGTSLRAHSRSLDSVAVPNVVMVCPATQPILATNFHQFTCLRVVFTSGTAALLYGPSTLRQLRNEIPDSCRTVDRHLAFLHERLQTAPDIAGKIKLLDLYFLKKLRYISPGRRLFPHFYEAIHGHHEPRRTVQDIADHLGLSRQHLNRLAWRELGYSAQETLRVLRFVGALQELHLNPQRSIAEIAYRMDYYDPAHFTHTFKTYTEIAPTQYVRQGGRRTIYSSDGDLLHSGMVTTEKSAR